MSDNLVKLLTQRFAIERRIHQLKNSNLTESQSSGADAMLAKLEAALAKVNEEYAIQQNMPMAEKENHPAPTDHPDHEVSMARSDLYRAGKSAMALEKMLQQVSEQQGIEGWVQAKITKAADYLESVYHYFDYEMHGNGEVDEAAAYGPGQNSTNPEAEENVANQQPMALGGQQQQQPQAPGAPQQTQQLKPGQASATPQTGGAGPMATADGMVKMAKLGPDKQPLGTPIIVKPTDIVNHQKQGYYVIGESSDKPKAKVVHCSQCGKGFSGSRLTAPHQTGFSHCKDHKGMKIVAESASAGASSAGGMGASPTGFASGGIGMQKRKKKIGEGMMVSRADADAALKNPEAKAIWGRYGQYNAQDLTQEFSNLSPNDAAMIANWAEGGWAQGHSQAEMRGKLVHSILQLKQGLGESEGGDYGPKARGIADGYYGRPPNPHKVITDETGKRMRVKLTDPAEIAEYMAGYKDDSFGSKNYGESVAEAGFGSGISTPTMRARTASKFGHDPDRAAPMYKANKYDPKTGLGGYVAPRGDTTDKSNILLQLKSNLDTATGKPLTFRDGSTLAIKPSIARAALAKIDAMRPVEKHETIKNLMTSKDAFIGFVKGQSEGKDEGKDEGQGPKFTGYYKGKDKGKPGKKMVGGI